ncbi:MAG: pilus assembly protein [Acidimicrobiia bacterium]|nr:pilus assembly protein [Acidimicrobiia bacterium]
MHLRSSDQGASLVEAALVMPILIMLVFGVVEFGRAYNAQISLTHAAREAIREYAISQNTADAEDVAENSAPTLDSTLMNFNFGPCNPGAPAQVTIGYPFTYEIPLFGNNTVDLTGIGVMRCGG